MNDDRKRKLAELEAMAAEQDRKAEERDFKQLDEYLADAADAVVDAIVSLAEQLAELDLVGADNSARPLWRVDPESGTVTAIEADHPDDGKRLYWFYGDAIIATRRREDGRYETATLDGHGMPIEWRTTVRPDLN